jgi:hypothetical protein
MNIRTIIFVGLVLTEDLAVAKAREALSLDHMDPLSASKTISRTGSICQRLLLFAGIGGLLLLALLPLTLRKSGSAGVALSFIGFTNRPLAIEPKTPGVAQGSILLPQALLMAKNTGSVSIELWAALSQDKLSINSGTLSVKDGFWQVDGVGLPHLLKPGEWMFLTATPNGGSTWSTEVQYQRRGSAGRFWGALWDSRVPPLQAASQKLGSSAFELVPVKLGPLTNQPPPVRVLTPLPNVQLEGPPQGLRSPLPSQEVRKPGYSLDLIDTHYQPAATLEKP